MEEESDDRDDEPVLFPEEVDDDNELKTPEGIVAAAEKARENLLPDKSGGRYRKTYNEFMRWHKRNKLKSFSQNVFLAYFCDLSVKCKPSSLWPYHSMLKKVFKIKHNIDLEEYAELVAFIKKKNKNYKPTQANSF